MSAVGVAAVCKCRFCGCTAENPCSTVSGDECCFMGAKADRCNNKPCVLAYDRERDEQIKRYYESRRLAAELRRKKGGRR